MNKLTRNEMENLCLQYHVKPLKKLNMFELSQELKKKGYQINCDDYKRSYIPKPKSVEDMPSEEEITIVTKDYIKITLQGLNYEIIQMKKPYAFYPNGFEEKVLSKGKFTKSFIDNNSVLLKVRGKNSYILGSMKFKPPRVIVEFKNDCAVDINGNLYLFNKDSILSNDKELVSKNLDMNDPEKLYWNPSIKRCALSGYVEYF